MQTKKGKRQAEELAFLYNLKRKEVDTLYKLNEEIIKGGPVEVVEAMKQWVYDPDQFKTLDEYIEWLVSSTWRFHGKGINIQGESLEERCESLVRQLVDNGLLEEID